MQLSHHCFTILGKMLFWDTTKLQVPVYSESANGLKITQRALMSFSSSSEMRLRPLDSVFWNI